MAARGPGGFTMHVGMNTRKISELRSQILVHEQELRKLKAELQVAEDGVCLDVQTPGSSEGDPQRQGPGRWPWPLEADEYKRYGRQMILPEVSLQGQLHLKNASVLLIGMGGLGCPAAAYLAGAGVGTLGLMDGDRVELSNLHRQILHTNDRVGLLKVESARASLEALNPGINYVTYASHLTPVAALELFAGYDLILDCTDQPASRYLISDAAVLTGKPVVSGAALRTDGVLNVLNVPCPTASDPSARGPCYRCIYPVPPPPETVTPCGEGGILGPVVGVMGVLMALEATKLIMSGTLHSAARQHDPSVSTFPGESPRHPMLLFSAMSEPQFRIARLRGKRMDCAACSASPKILAESLVSGSLDYVQFCGVAAMPCLGDEYRISAQELSALRLLAGSQNGRGLPNITGSGDGAESGPFVLDVRPRAQFLICNLPGSINIPITDLDAATDIEEVKDLVKAMGQRQSGRDIVAICRQGNDSREAVQKLQLLLSRDDMRVRDVEGGFDAWRSHVDPTWPEY